MVGRTGHRILCGGFRRQSPCARPERLVLAHHGTSHRQRGCRRLGARGCAPSGDLPAPWPPAAPQAPARPGPGLTASPPPTAPGAPLSPPLPPPSPSPAALRARSQPWGPLGPAGRGRGDRPGGPRRGREEGGGSLASRCQATARSPRRGPAAVLLSPAVGSALPLAAPARRSAPIERPPPLPRPHWRAALWPRRVTFSHHSPRLLRQRQAGRWAGPGRWQL